MNDRDAERLGEALALARQAAERGEVPVGAVLYRGDERLGGEGNLRRAECSDPTGHAEVRVLRAAAQQLGDWRLEGATLYVTLEPCLMCLAVCQHARVDRVVYGAEDPKGGAISLGYRPHEDARLNHRFIADFRSMTQCGDILTEFFQKRRAEKSKI